MMICHVPECRVFFSLLAMIPLPRSGNKHFVFSQLDRVVFCRYSSKTRKDGELKTGHEIFSHLRWLMEPFSNVCSICSEVSGVLPPLRAGIHGEKTIHAPTAGHTLSLSRTCHEHVSTPVTSLLLFLNVSTIGQWYTSLSFKDVLGIGTSCLS